MYFPWYLAFLIAYHSFPSFVKVPNDSYIVKYIEAEEMYASSRNGLYAHAYFR